MKQKKKEIVKFFKEENQFIFMTSKNITIATKEEIEKIMPWFIELAQASFDKVNKEMLKENISKSQSSFPEGFVVYKFENRIIGFLWFDFNLEKKSAFIHGIYVDKKFRGKKIAQEIMEYLKKICIKKQIKKIDLNVTSTMKEAIRFYEKEKFQIKRYQMSLSL